MFKPPYYAVIFTSKQKELNSEESVRYANLAEKMVELASDAQGFLGVDSVRDTTRLGITVSYWSDLDSIRKWRLDFEHTMARNQRDTFYSYYSTRITRVEREYEYSLMH